MMLWCTGFPLQIEGVPETGKLKIGTRMVYLADGRRQAPEFLSQAH
jgi:hypothetical protein